MLSVQIENDQVVSKKMKTSETQENFEFEYWYKFNICTEICSDNTYFGSKISTTIFSFIKKSETEHINCLFP